MATITATEFQRHFGEFMDKALLEPIRITQRGRSKAVLISEEAYRNLLAGQPRIKALQTADIPDHLFNEIVRPYSHEDYEAGGIRPQPTVK